MMRKKTNLIIMVNVFRKFLRFERLVSTATCVENTENAWVTLAPNITQVLS